MSKKQSSLIRLTGLWVNESRDGDSFLSGQIGPTAGLLILPNKHKRPGSKAPDYIAYMSAGQEDEKDEPAEEPELSWKQNRSLF